MTRRGRRSMPRRSCRGLRDIGATSARATSDRLRRALRLGFAGIVAGVLAVGLTGCFSAPPQIISLEPNRGSTSVAADTPVRVVFDRSVTRSSVAGRFTVTATLGGQTVSPAIPGCDLTNAFAAAANSPCWIHWLDPEPGFELMHPRAVFRAATQYHFTLAGGFSDPQGDRNGLDHHWDLTTAPAPVLTVSTPGDRAADVAVDARLAVAFSAPMDASTTAAAITLTPDVSGTRVVRNAVDHSRFVILPGRLLEPGVSYTVSVSRVARGDVQQFIAVAATVHFTTGSRMEGPHAVVLAGVQGENATEVVVPALARGAPGEPIAAPVLLQAERCTLSSGCGAVPLGGPLQTYGQASVSADGTHIAVVVNDNITATSSLEVIDAVLGAVLADIPNGTLSSWSPDGSRVALVVGSAVDAFEVRSQQLSVLATAAALTGPPLWAGNTTLVLSTAAQPGTPAAVELIDRAVDARYDLPGAPAGSTAVAVSPGGSRIALATTDGGVVVTSAPGAPGSPQRLSGHLQALGFAGEGTLVAVSRSGETQQLVRISVGGADNGSITLSIGTPDLQSVRVTQDGRRLVCLASDANGVRQAFVADADGTGEVAMTGFTVGGLEAQAVDLAR